MDGDKLDQYRILNTKRKGIMDRIKEFGKFCSDLEHFHIQPHINAHSVILYELELRLIKIEPLYAEFDKVATRMEDLGYDSCRSEFEKLYFKPLAIAKAKIKPNFEPR
ncbi:hypothetical protein PYW08_014400 [Mythimna loreyi]|uniref:Uncharacterized protein n=1 Tax=Mythimna loreyi TaxID=667449 RepID=A0ACC2R7A1_9NEOP|nr:hypothetical protein PYW08_014400 [Mythimna loreyi]